jgi:hypothetical protein
MSSTYLDSEIITKVKLRKELSQKTAIILRRLPWVFTLSSFLAPLSPTLSIKINALGYIVSCPAATIKNGKKLKTTRGCLSLDQDLASTLLPHNTAGLPSLGLSAKVFPSVRVSALWPGLEAPNLRMG